MSNLLQTTQFIVKELSLETKVGNVDISEIFDKLDIFDNMFLSCMSGCVMIRDGRNLLNLLQLDGNEYIKIKILKSDDLNIMQFEKRFRIFKISDIKNVNFTLKIFRLHFMSEEYLLSEQTKITKTYSGSYSSFVEKILTDTLKVSTGKSTGNKSGIATIHKSSGNIDSNIPTMTPFDTIVWISNRAVYKTLPNYVFFENKEGYNFASLDVLYSSQPICGINFNPKNINKYVGLEMFGARKFKILSTFDVMTNITGGGYAGKFTGFDTLTRELQTNKIDYVNDIFNKMKHPNKNPLLPKETDVNKQYDSRVVVYPYSLPRRNNDYVKKNNSKLANKTDNTEDYVFHRKAIFNALMQRRIQIVLPGNFDLCSGKLVEVYLPDYVSNDGGNKNYDDSMSGKYIIIGTRHTIYFNRHETIIEVATDSTNK